MTTQPVDFYYWTTPNCWKVTIFLEETGLPYRLVPIDITGGAQFAEDFVRISPASKVPALVDPKGPDDEPIALFESGAVLLYLAEKTGQFGPRSARERAEMLPWLMFQMASVGPMLGQNHHFRQYAPERIPYAVERYMSEARRIYDVMDRHLQHREYFCGCIRSSIWPCTPGSCSTRSKARTRRTFRRSFPGMIGSRRGRQFGARSTSARNGIASRRTLTKAPAARCSGNRPEQPGL